MTMLATFHQLRNQTKPFSTDIELQELETKISQTQKLINKKRTKLENLQSQNKGLTQGDDINEPNPQLIQLEEEINLLRAEKQQIESDLHTYFPYTLFLRTKVQELEQLFGKRDIYSSEKDYYEERLAIDIKKITNLEKKLEQVRNLLADNELGKLKTLMKKGQL